MSSSVSICQLMFGKQPSRTERQICRHSQPSRHRRNICPLRAALLVLLSCSTVVQAGNDHLDMFNCKGKTCAVTELTDSNWQEELSKAPHLVMYVCCVYQTTALCSLLLTHPPTRFYAPWCGHCRVLAPKLKKAAKAMVDADAQIRIGGLNVEPNRGVQSLYRDIQGFPWLKFVTSPTDPRGALNYRGVVTATLTTPLASLHSDRAFNTASAGEMEEKAIVSFLTEQAKSLGILAADEELVVDEGTPDFETKAQRMGGQMDQEAWTAALAAVQASKLHESEVRIHELRQIAEYHKRSAQQLESGIQLLSQNMQ